MNEPPRSISGFLNVDKPPGWTSADVVAKMRSAFGLRKRKLKIGHGGTLDPMATGVLPICIGNATRLSAFVLGGDKTYVMSARLGAETDTYDAEGDIVESRNFGNVTLENLRSVVAEFVGEIDQVPPMYSAIKKDGTPLYKLARQGKSIPREPRRVQVASLQLTSCEIPVFETRIECGSGFYARSLAHDIGKRLGCGAHMTSLRRERAGEFHITDSLSLADLLAAAEDDSWLRYLVQPDHVLNDLVPSVLDDAAATAFVRGQGVQCEFNQTVEDDRRVRVYSRDGSLLGLGQREEGDDILAPKIVLRDVTTM